MSVSIAQAFAAIQQEETIRALRMENARLRQVISCAYCPSCGDEIADQEWTINDDDQLVHKSCDDSALTSQDPPAKS